MRPSYQTLIGSAAVPINGAWVPLSYNVENFNCTVAGIMNGAAAAMTWLLQYTLDDPVFERALRTVSQSGNTITVTDFGGNATNSTQLGPGGAVGHGLAVGDYVSLKGCGSGMDGEYDIASVPSLTSYTVTSSVSRTATAPSGARVTPLRVWIHPMLSAVTASRTFGTIGIGQPPTVSPVIVMAIRPQISAWTSGNLDFTVLHAGMGT